MENYKINNDKNIFHTSEISINWNIYNFLVIYGNYMNKWFIAIPNWNICVEAGCPEDDFYNNEKLRKVISIENAPSVIARAIREHWEGLRNEQ